MVCWFPFEMKIKSKSAIVFVLTLAIMMLSNKFSMAKNNAMILYFIYFLDSMILQGGLVGQDFLMEIMELREEVDDKNSDDDLKILLQQNRIRIKDTCSDLSLAFEKRDLSSAMKLTGILQYWNRIEEKIVDKISSVE